MNVQTPPTKKYTFKYICMGCGFFGDPESYGGQVCKTCRAPGAWARCYHMHTYPDGCSACVPAKPEAWSPARLVAPPRSAVEAAERLADAFVKASVPAPAGPDRYASLRCVLAEAAAQAERGKGHERHDGGEAFEEQPIVVIGRWLGSNHYELGQAIKKARESARLPKERARNELLGAINYLAAAVLRLDEEK